MANRALLVGATGGPRTPGLLADLAAYSDVLVAVDGGADTCLAAGISPDVVVGDMDSLSESALTALDERGTRLIRFSPDKDQTDLELALGHACDLAATEIICTGVLGGRVDHTLAALGAMARMQGRSVSVTEDDQVGWFAHSGEVIELRGAGVTVSVLALPGEAIVSVDGTRWPLADHLLPALGALGISNVLTSDVAHVTVHRGCVLILAPTVDGAKPSVVASRHSRKE